VRVTVPEEALADEHPAIAALMLSGRPPLEQAGILRRLPAGGIRATHRYLRHLERRGLPA
jgi:flagellar motor switch protein FliG